MLLISRRMLLIKHVVFLCFVPLLGKSLLTDKASKFCLVWLVGYWFVIECVPTKLPHYILPLLPALALLTSLALTRSLPVAGRKLARLIDAGYIVAAPYCAACFSGLR